MSLDKSIESIRFDAHLDKFLLFGDSITSRCYSYEEGKSFLFGAALNDLYNRRLSIVHRGFSGYNSEMGRYILPKIIEAEHSEKTKIRVATVFFGSNDAVKENDHIQHVSLERFEENIRFLTEELLKIGAKVILVSPAVHDENKRNKMFPGDPSLNPRSTARNLEYGKVVAKVAKELNVGYIDLWHRFLESVGWKEGEPIPGALGVEGEKSIDHLLNDGLHFTGEGYRVFYEALLEAIQTRYPELVPSQLPFLYPEWANFKTGDFN